MKRLSAIILVWSMAFQQSANAEPAGTTASVERAVRSFITERRHADSLVVEIRLQEAGRLADYSSDLTDIQIDWQKGNDALTGRVSIPFLLKDGKGASIRSYAAANIRLFDRVCIASRHLNRNTILDVKDITIEMREITPQAGQTVKHPAGLTGKRIKRVVGRGRIITVDMTEAPPVIEKGESIEITIVHQNLELTASGIAREDGWMGDEIRVRYKKNPEEFTALVKGPGLVSVKI